ncbi:MAG: iron-containing alcohol dehydrogenase [Actinomycetota bacterium]
MAAPHIVLVGLMGVGKSSVGRALAREMKRPFVDTDSVIESNERRTIADIFATDGESGFREIERRTLDSVLASTVPAVIATGGGVVETGKCREALLHLPQAGARVVWLSATIATMAERTGRSNNRPLLAGDREANLARLLDRRRGFYEEVSDVKIDTDGKPVTRIVREVMNAVPQASTPAGGRRVRVALGKRSYDVAVGAGAISQLGSMIPADVKRAVIVSQVGVPSIPEIDLPTHLVHIGDGEHSKTLATIEDLSRQFAQFGLTRNDLVIGVGGGLVTDVAGFAAASWHRGTRVVHVATTLLAMVDAAIGGKTGVNLPEGKNLVGAFWQPTGVICDTNWLATLPERELRCGWGEVAKYHFLTGDDLLAMPTDERIARCVQIKADIVAQDEREGGRRALLNYGHTFGHAIETVTGHHLAHGEAVAIGIVCAAHLARLMGRIDDSRVEAHYRVLDAYGLQSQLPAGLDHDALLVAMGRDKKATAGLVFILDGLNGLATVSGVDPAHVLESLALAAGVR